MKLQHQLARHDIRYRHFSACLQTYICNNYHLAYHILSLLFPLTLDQRPQTPSFKGENPNSTLRAQYPSKPTGRCVQGCGFHTTKIMLDLARASRQQSQPFMVRVEINIAESREWGASQLPQGNTFMGAGLCG